MNDFICIVLAYWGYTRECGLCFLSVSQPMHDEIQFYMKHICIFFTLRHHLLGEVCLK